MTDPEGIAFAFVPIERAGDVLGVSRQRALLAAAGTDARTAGFRSEIAHFLTTLAAAEEIELAIL